MRMSSADYHMLPTSRPATVTTTATTNPTSTFSWGDTDTDTATATDPTSKINWVECLRAILVIMLGILISIELITVIAAMYVDANYPDFEINTFSFSNFNYSSPNQLSADWNIDLIVKNTKNIKTFQFSQTRVSVLYKQDEVLWVTNFRPFDLGPGNATKHLSASFWGSTGLVEDSTAMAIADVMRTDVGAVRFNVKLETRIKSWWHGVEIARPVTGYCKDVDFFMSSGRMFGASKECLIK